MKETVSPQAVFIAAVYFIVSALYIFFSDALLDGLVNDPLAYSRIQSYKGTGFVFLSALLIFYVVNRQFIRKNALIRDLRFQKNEFESLNEEYLASNEELHHANALIAESEKTLLTTLYSIGEGMITTGPDCKILRMNPVAETLTGWSEQEAWGKPCSEIFHIVDEITGEDLENPAGKVLREGKPTPTTSHTVLISKSGEVRPVTETAAPVISAANNLQGAVLVFRDQTEERKSQKSLLINTFCLDHSSVGICHIAGESGKITDINEPMCRMFGYTREEFVSMTIFDLDPTLRKSRWDAFTPDLKKQERAMIETIHRTKDGRDIPVEVNVSYFEYQGEPFIFSFVKDITERRQNMEKLEESEERYRSIFENEHTVMFLIDPVNGTVEDANPAAEKFYGWSRDKLRTMKVSEINIQPEEEIFGFIDEVFSSGGTGFELRHKLANGEIRDVEVFSGPICVNGKSLIYTIVNDITERNKSRLELVKAKEKAEENDKLKSAFLNNMSHEIRTPMNGILGFSSLLLQEGLSDTKRQDYVRIIESSGHQLVRIIDDIIDYSRIETGQVQIALKKFSLNRTLDTILALLGQEAQKQKKNLSLRVRKGLSDGKDILVSDEGRLSQILINLMINSLKFTEKGYIEMGYTSQWGADRILCQGHRRGHTPARPGEDLRAVSPGEYGHCQVIQRHRPRAVHCQGTHRIARRTYRFHIDAGRRHDLLCPPSLPQILILAGTQSADAIPSFHAKDKAFTLMDDKPGWKRDGELTVLLMPRDGACRQFLDMFR